jgi:hypothetical protein
MAPVQQIYASQRDAAPGLYAQQSLVPKKCRDIVSFPSAPPRVEPGVAVDLYLRRGVRFQVVRT